MNDEYAVYQIDLSDGMQYVGMTKNLEQRIKLHSGLAESVNSSVVRHRIANPGVEIEERRVLAQGLTKEQAKKLERETVKALKRPLNRPASWSSKMRRTKDTSRSGKTEWYVRIVLTEEERELVKDTLSKSDRKLGPLTGRLLVRWAKEEQRKEAKPKKAKAKQPRQPVQPKQEAPLSKHEQRELEKAGQA